jgi:hypothetical protein
LKIGPGRIGKHQDITIRILIDGNRDESRRLTCQSPLIDVQTKRGPAAGAPALLWLLFSVMAVLIAVVNWVATYVQFLEGGSGVLPGATTAQANRFTACAFGLAVVLAAAGLAAWIRQKSREGG